MFSIEQYDALAKKLFAVLPKGLQTLEKETEEKFKEVLYAVFARMDLVTREEFDTQTKVLTRAREKIEDLQKQVASLMAAEK
jgi:BMFP domain-containing protein YqiC